MSTGAGLTPRVRAACLAAYVGVTFLSFPHPVGSVVIDFGLVLGWVAPAFLLLGLTGLAPGRAALHAFLAAWLAQAAILHWLYVVTVTYGHASPWVGVLAPFGAALYHGAITAAFGAAWAWWWQRGGRSPFVAAILWTAFDYTRSFFLTGFPWATLGYSQHENIPLLGIVASTGIYGLSFAVFLGGAALGLAFWARRAGLAVPRACWVALAVVVLLHLLGPLLRPAPPGSDAATVRVAALQGNIAQGKKWSPEWVARTYAIYEELSRDAARQGATLIVWPETAVPEILRDTDTPQRLLALLRDTGAVLVVGAVGFEGASPGSPGPRRYYDSAFAFDERGTETVRYDKSHLVPFGEYVPFRDLLGGLLRGVATGIAPGDVSQGRGPESFAVAPLRSEGREMGTSNGFLVGAPICYELLFPDLVRRFVGKGARLLLALTNDAWYGRTGAPYQFLAITALRSAETGVYTVRAANSGISAIIDSSGRVEQQLPIFERGFLVADVPLRDPMRAPTFYVRYGDVFAWACCVGVLALGIYGALSRRRGGSHG